MSRGVKLVETEAELADALAVRRAVFVDEQGVPPSLEVDEYDTLDGATHFVAYERRDEGREKRTSERTAETASPERDAIGAARLRPYDGSREEKTAKVERVAVLEPVRGRGWGQRLMDAVEETARAQGVTRLVLHAQTAVEGFYAARGYTRVGEEFEEASIPHVEMVRIR